MSCGIILWVSQMTQPARNGNDDKTDVWQGTLALMVLTTLERSGRSMDSASLVASSRRAVSGCR